MTLGNSHTVPVPQHPSKAKADGCVTGCPSPSCLWCPRWNSQQLSLPLRSSPALASLYLRRAQKQHHSRLGGCNQSTELVCNQFSLPPMQKRAASHHGACSLFSVETRTLWANADLQGTPVLTLWAKPQPLVQWPGVALRGWSSLLSNLFSPSSCSSEEPCQKTGGCLRHLHLPSRFCAVFTLPR